jgi:hypothetical protein
VADQFDHYLLAGRRRRGRGLSPARLAGHVAAVALVFDGEAGWLAQVVALSGRASDATLLNPHGHGLLTGGTLLPLHRAEGGVEAGPGEPAALGRVELPCALAGGVGSCAPPRPWPERELVLVTLLGPAGAPPDAPPPMRWDAGRRRLVLPWAEVELLR